MHQADEPKLVNMGSVARQAAKYHKERLQSNYWIDYLIKAQVIQVDDSCRQTSQPASNPG
jgi:hypothetical protein